MKTVKEAVDHFLPKKRSGEMSLSDIRHELTDNSDFSEAEINSICEHISDRELESLDKKKMWKLDFLDNIYFSIFMILASIAIFIFSMRRFMQLKDLSDQGAEIDDIDYFLPSAFMLASVIYFLRHVFRIIKRSKSKK